MKKTWNVIHSQISKEFVFHSRKENNKSSYDAIPDAASVCSKNQHQINNLKSLQNGNGKEHICLTKWQILPLIAGILPFIGLTIT